MTVLQKIAKLCCQHFQKHKLSIVNSVAIYQAPLHWTMWQIQGALPIKTLNRMGREPNKKIQLHLKKFFFQR